MVMPHISPIKNGFDVIPGPSHNDFIFSDISLIIPVDKIIFKTGEKADSRED
jgi:hypothetical protein